MLNKILALNFFKMNSTELAQDDNINDVSFENLVKEEKLGKRRSLTVWKVRHIRNGKEYALKEIQFDKISKENEIYAEALRMKELNNDHILKY